MIGLTYCTYVTVVVVVEEAAFLLEDEVASLLAGGRVGQVQVDHDVAGGRVGAVVHCEGRAHRILAL